MSIPILAVAFGIYILGVSIVLYLKPQIMFGKSGDWKEFGIGRGDARTVVPFWLFAIFWAFISYGLGLVIMSQFASIANGPFPEQNLNSMIHLPSMTMQNPTSVVQTPTQVPSATPVQQSNDFMKPVSSAFGLNNSMPGYYVLQNPGSMGAPPQYVYYGNQPPQM